MNKEETQARNFANFRKKLKEQGIEINHNQDDIRIISCGKSHIYFKKFKGKAPGLFKTYEAVSLSYLIIDGREQWVMSIITNKRSKSELPNRGECFCDFTGVSLGDAWRQCCQAVDITP